LADAESVLSALDSGLWTFLLGALVGEEELLGQAGERAEVGASELGELWGAPTFEAVATGEGLEDPHVDGKGFEPARAEEKDAVGDFLPDAGELAESGLGGGVGESFGFLKPAGMRGEKAGGFADVFGAKTEQAGAEVAFGDGCENGPGGEGVAGRS